MAISTGWEANCFLTSFSVYDLACDVVVAVMHIAVTNKAHVHLHREILINLLLVLTPLRSEHIDAEDTDFFQSRKEIPFLVVFSLYDKNIRCFLSFHLIYP